MTSPDQPDPTDPDFIRNPPAPDFTVERPVNSLYLSYSDPEPGEAPTMAHELLDEAQGVEELLKDVSGDVTAVARRVSIATDRRRAARFAPAVLLAREMLDTILDDLAQVDACIDIISDALGPVVRDEHPHISEARLALHRARGIVEKTGETGREFAHIGTLATERVSDFAEADMLYEQILRDLRRRDLAAVDERIPRLVEVERVLVARGVTAKLVEVRRRREELAAGGRWDQGGWVRARWDRRGRGAGADRFDEGGARGGESVWGGPGWDGPRGGESDWDGPRGGEPGWDAPHPDDTDDDYTI